MKTTVRTRLLGWAMLLGTLSATAQQDCKDDINYSISNVTFNGAGINYVATDDNIIQVTIGQPYVGFNGSRQQGIRSNGGFWSYYNAEPQAPIANASEGEYVDRIEVEWEVVDDYTGPQVTETLTQVFRNGRLLTTVPLNQTSYVDYNVFPGEFYTYEIVTTNQFGDAKPIEAVGFLNPNGRVTGKVETRNGTPVSDVKVVLTPNLGRSLDFDGIQDYVYFLDQSFAFDSTYTVEGWWRNVETKAQTIFSAVDSGTTNIVLKISLDDEGRLRYFHDGDADGTGIELSSRDGYNLDQFSRGWHHFAAVYDTASVYLYVDGNRVAESAIDDPITVNTELEIGKEGPKLYTNYYAGFLDDFRIWNDARSREEVRRFKDITLTGEEEDLFVYWKFDEQFSNKVFDFAAKPVEEREHGYLCEVDRSDFISPAQLGAYTDAGGDYIIKGVFYGGGQTFQVTPSKSTPVGFSLEFDGTDDFISFQRERVVIDEEFTLEGWFKTGVDGQQMTLFEATDSETDDVLISLNIGTTGTFLANVGFGASPSSITTTESLNDEFWYHYALTHDGATATLYIDGEVVGTTTDAAIDSVVSRIVIGRSDPVDFNDGSDYFEGNLDEIRLWNYARTENQVNATLNQIIPGNEQGIVDPDGELGISAYWMLGEGQGSIISDATPNGINGNLLNFQKIALSEGDSLVANWEGDDIPLSTEFFVHDFDPNARNVSLDPSNTSVDRVDFTDISQIGISGFITFSDTDCFVEGMEMTLNGSSVLPPVFTDEEGKFFVELEPGTTGAILSAKFGDFQLDPGFIELPRLVRPIAGLEFQVTTKRTLKGVVAGGECSFATGTADVRLLANEDCYEVTVPVDETTGIFEVSDLPPKVFFVSVVDHNDTEIQSAFDLQGAITVDLREEDDSVSFIYTSPTQTAVEFARTESNDCDIQLDGETAELLNQSSTYNLRVQLYQVYGTDTCYLNNGVAYIEDEISDFSPRDTLELVNGLAEYEFTAGVPNLASPYNKSITVTGEDENGDQATGFKEVIVLGYKTLTSTFETTTPELPLFILRDPPGDGSFSFLEENESVCNTMSFDYKREASDNVSAAVHMGPDITFSTGFIFSKETEIDVTLDMEIETSATNGFGTSVQYESCLTSSEIFKTSSNDLLSDSEGDIFVGGAMNVLVGTNRVIKLNSATCAIELEDVLMVLPKSFATTYIYTQQFIKENVIPGLEEINNTESVEQWESILDYNDSLKSTAIFEENLSFSSGIEFERSVTASEVSTSSMSLSSAFVSEIGLNTGLTIDGMGFSLGVSTAFEREEGFTRTSENSTSKTVGYALNDDDIGDNFTIDVKKDGQGMPVFDLVAGETSCPWEPGTRNRAAVNVTALSPTTVVEVPEDEPAVFKYALGNVSETGESDFYEFRVVQESNPDGAVIKVNGVLVEDNISFFVRGNESEEVTVTVEKGPEAFTYNDLIFEFYFPCEYERALDLSLDIENLIANDPDRANFFARQTANVEFVKTCQDVTIFAPGADWLVNKTSNNALPITISDIDLTQTEFERLFFQYRRLIEGEPFVNGATIESTDIAGASYSFNWDVTNIPDGAYELRVTSECNAGFAPGLTETVNGRIDRQAPVTLGTPTPVDAILGPDDQITITFEEEIKCDDIISLAIPASLETGSMNNVALSNTETGLYLEATVTCTENQLVIVPKIENKFIEGQVLRMDILGVQDLFGNIQTEMITWEFRVDRDPLEWLGGDVQIVALEGESPSFTRQVKNNGAFAVNVNLSGKLDVQTLEETLLPSWIASATPRSFTLQPGGTQDVTFTISDQLGGGQYNDMVTAATSFGAPELLLDVRILCPDPAWEVDASKFENSMTFVGELEIRGEPSTDEFDIVAAFVGDEIRGVGNVEFVPELTANAGPDIYRVFMTLYTNSTSSEMIEFQVWDASRCQLYGQIAETYNISLQTTSLGSPTNPVSITVTNDIIQEIPLSAGWNWISFNLSTGTQNTNDRLGTLLNSQRGDIIKSQSAFSQFVPSLGWVGPLSELDSTQAFRIKIGEADTLRVVGEPIDFENTTLELDSGWNWVSFLPPVAMDINTALSSVTATADFIIKSQTDFAQYVDFQGWIGSLDFMGPNQGYLMYVDRSLSIDYPVTDENARNMEVEEEVMLPDGWELDLSNFETNSNIIATVGTGKVSEGSLIGLFDGEKLVGYGQAQYLDFQDEFYFFVTYSAMTDGTELSIKLYSDGDIYESSSKVTSSSGEVLGTVQDPYVIDMPGLTLGVDLISNDITIYPNPFNDRTTLDIDLAANSTTKIVIQNILGQDIAVLHDGMLSRGKHSFEISKNAGDYRLNAGLYIVSILIDTEISHRKVIVK